MRTSGAAALLVCVLLASLQPAFGQQACPPGRNPGGDKLGVARTVVIDAAGGPHFGAQYKSRGLLAEREVVLTFDDGPSRANTRSILDALAAQCTKATFFMVGRRALSDPEMVKEVERRGHTVATHTWSHANLQSLSEAKMEAEIELGFSAVQLALGKPIAPFFRFPYLRDTPASLERLRVRKVATIGIDIDSRDFETKAAAAVHERVMHDLASRRRGIILFHDIHAWTAQAVPGILADLKARGFRVVHLAPKAGAETVAEYDALARQEAESKRVVSSGNPLSKRTIVWPATGSSAAQTLAKAAPATPPEPPPASPAPAAPKESAAKEEDWREKVWRDAN